MSPKVVVYVRAEDARVIEVTEGREIEHWVRSLVRDAIAEWHRSRSSSVASNDMPESWKRRQEELEQGE